MPPPAAARQRRKEARPQELLDAALDVFVEKGFAAARTDDVAHRAGVSKGTLYLYFPSKDDLLKAVIRHSVAAQIAEGARIVDQHDGSATSLLIDHVAPWWRRLQAQPASGVFKLMIAEARNFPELGEFYSREVIEPGVQVLTRVLERGVRSGEFRVGNMRHAVYSLLLPLVMACVHRHSLGACALPSMLDMDRFIDDHVRTIVDALRVCPCDPPTPIV
jgi:AcrR family transcriptional regulator